MARTLQPGVGEQVQTPSKEGRWPGTPKRATPGQAVSPLHATGTKADHAYHQIRQMIIEGRLEPGTHLDQETIAVELQLSTTPLREALNRLESEGLVVYRAHRRTVVAPLTREALDEIYAVRLELDPLAARCAAKVATDDDVGRILTLATRRPEPDPHQALHGNRELHRAIYSASGNAVLIRILEMLWDRSDRYRLMTLNAEGTIALAHDEHLAIATAIQDRDSSRAAELMRQHIASSFVRIRQFDFPTESS